LFFHFYFLFFLKKLPSLSFIHERRNKHTKLIKKKKRKGKAKIYITDDIQKT
jgi:hypothetical protein